MFAQRFLPSKSCSSTEPTPACARQIWQGGEQEGEAGKVSPCAGWPRPQGSQRDPRKAAGSQPSPGWHSLCWGSRGDWGGVSWLNVLQSHRERAVVEGTEIVSLLPSDVNNTIPKEDLALGMGSWAPRSISARPRAGRERSAFEG